MQLKSLKVFCDVVGWRSFSRAATENGISQSGASQVVHQLERRLGVRLIDRSKRPFVLTPEGETYYEGCRKLVQRYDALEDQVRTLHEEVSGRVRVVSIYSVGLHHMSRYLQKFLSQYPKANVRLEYQHPHRVYEAVEKDHADLGLVSYPRASRTMEAIPWREEPMVLVCAPGHRLAGFDKIALEDLAGEKVIGFDSDLTIRREIDRVLQLHAAEVRVVMEFDNIETIKRAIEIDAGVALLPEPTVLREVEAGSLVMIPLATEELVRPLGIIHRRGKEMGSTARRFIELLQSESGYIDGDLVESSGPRNGALAEHSRAWADEARMNDDLMGDALHDHLLGEGALRDGAPLSEDKAVGPAHALSEHSSDAHRGRHRANGSKANISATNGNTKTNCFHAHETAAGPAKKGANERPARVRAK